MRVSERNKDSEKRGGGLFFSPLRGHRLRKKAAPIPKDDERALDLTLRGGGGGGGRREGGGEEGDQGGAKVLRMEDEGRTASGALEWDRGGELREEFALCEKPCSKKESLIGWPHP